MKYISREMKRIFQEQCNCPTSHSCQHEYDYKRDLHVDRDQ